jgi:hypothetical protein
LHGFTLDAGGSGKMIETPPALAIIRAFGFDTHPMI